MSRLTRFLPLLLLAALALAAYASGATEQVTVEGLRVHEAQLRQAVTDHRVAAVAIYIVVYGLVTGVCLPVALVMTLSGGFLFGPWIGGAATVVGATLGAVITYMAVRFAAAAWVRRHYDRSQGALRKIIDGFDRNVFAYILTLRLIPLFPFAVVNVAAGLARAPVRAYVLATLVGAVPTSLIYSHLGAGLGKVFAGETPLNAGLMLEPQVLLPLLGLALLALAPVAISRRRRQKSRADLS
jgi:uncharacterized membrane protein YdjX (TVP38/TMEM64 family)